MLTFLKSLFEKEEGRTRQVINPGRLYELLVREFEATRPRCLAQCPMPLPLYAPRVTSEDCNWRLQRLVAPCVTCERTVMALFAKYAATYDVREQPRG